MITRKILITAALLLSSLLSWGQRTSAGTSAATLRGGYTGGGECASLMFSHYTLNGIYEIGVAGHGYTKPTSIDVDMPYGDFNVEAAYLWRLGGDYTHRFNVYGGFGGFIGYRIYDLGHKLPDDAYTGLKNSDFTYGLFPQLDVEYYIGDRLAVLLTGQVPVNFVSEIKSQIHYQGSLGVRFSF